MLQLLFLMVHSQALQYRAKQQLSQKATDADLKPTRHHIKGSVPASAQAGASQASMEGVEENTTSPDTSLSEYLLYLLDRHSNLCEPQAMLVHCLL